MTATQARSVLLVASFLLAYYSYNLYHFVAGTKDKTKSGQDERWCSDLLQKREDVSEAKKSNRNEVKEWDIEIGLLRPEEISSKKNSDIEADLQDDNNEHG